MNEACAPDEKQSSAPVVALHLLSSRASVNAPAGITTGDLRSRAAVQPRPGRRVIGPMVERPSD